MSWQKLLYLGTDSHLRQASTRERLGILETSPRYSEKVLSWQGRSNIAMMAQGRPQPGRHRACIEFRPAPGGKPVFELHRLYPGELPRRPVVSVRRRGRNRPAPGGVLQDLFRRQSLSGAGPRRNRQRPVQGGLSGDRHISRRERPERHPSLYVPPGKRRRRRVI